MTPLEKCREPRRPDMQEYKDKDKDTRRPLEEICPVSVVAVKNHIIMTRVCYYQSEDDMKKDRERYQPYLKIGRQPKPLKYLNKSVKSLSPCKNKRIVQEMDKQECPDGKDADERMEPSQIEVIMPRYY